MAEKAMWLTKEDNEDVIAQGTIHVTDSEKFNTLCNELCNLDTYVFGGCELRPGSSGNYVKYTSEGAMEYKNFGETEEYIRSHFVYRYINPRAVVHNLMFGRCSDWLQLFGTIDRQNSSERQLKSFKEARTIIKMLETCSLDNDVLELMIKQMWPNFGFYATEVLRCTDIEMGQFYDIRELNAIAEGCKKAGIKVSSEVENILRNKELAQSNGKVLSLAKQTHRMINSSK